jgi:hypothetical protein
MPDHARWETLVPLTARFSNRPGTSFILAPGEILEFMAEHDHDYRVSRRGSANPLDTVLVCKSDLDDRSKAKPY